MTENLPRIAVVTGGNRGLGRATARALAQRGLAVVLTYRGDADEASGAVEDIRAESGEAIAARLDLADVASFADFTASLRRDIDERWGRSGIDVLVNNAGIGLFGRLEDATVADFDAVIGTNLRGTFFLIQALAPHIGEGGRIINVSTSLTRHVSPGTSLYAASKTAVEALTRSLAVELGPRGIRINSIAPGPTATDFNGGAMRDDPELRSSLAAHTALGRVGRPDEIADAIAALAASELRWMTAERIEVSGGTLL
ncbi:MULTISPECIES: SDR family NAD(P)-dependent oxidoreductase [Microbacterium]|uniref:SDR family oxidoreductase n=1 Tax=Microbacterium wangchenii TaxID=2541726 RepID=A0ABX5ST86_9MICO|nr:MULTISPECIES: SDR family oxidoreductase [Microbacterium]MCK6067697.1 SDR family oxidoreductase [Microbacterium sp. EYE_512]QBR89388.1 SDR family oxidoreductase [Microbacterium wangchenii]TXK11061.1 SDR family oxidoreductase [Microbacterium wangchenii]